MNDNQWFYDVISILTKKLGGEVTITQAELRADVPPATVIRNDALGTITITSKEK